MPKGLKNIKFIFENGDVIMLPGLAVDNLCFSGIKRTGFTWSRNNAHTLQAKCQGYTIVLNKKADRRYKCPLQPKGITVFSRLNERLDIAVICIEWLNGNWLEISVPWFDHFGANMHQCVDYCNNKLVIKG